MASMILGLMVCNNLCMVEGYGCECTIITNELNFMSKQTESLRDIFVCDCKAGICFNTMIDQVVGYSFDHRQRMLIFCINLTVRIMSGMIDSIMATPYSKSHNERLACDASWPLNAVGIQAH